MAAPAQQEESQLLKLALTNAGFSSIQPLQILGFYTWCPEQAAPPYRYKCIGQATANEIRTFTISNQGPESIVSIDQLQLPVRFCDNLPKQVVSTKYPYANTGIASLLHAKAKCDLRSLDFYLGCSSLEILSAERKSGKKDRAPFFVMKVPGTQIVMIRYHFNFGQDYSVPGFQFERLMTGKELHDRHGVSVTEHVQLMQIGNFKALMSAEVDALDGAGNPVEVKLIKDGSMGGTKVFFQMIGSGCVSLYRGKHSNGVLTKVDKFSIDHMAERLAKNHDISALEGKLIRNLERLKEFDRLGWFDGDKVYRVDFNPKMELHRVNQSLLPPAKVVEEVLGLHSPSQKG